MPKPKEKLSSSLSSLVFLVTDLIVIELLLERPVSVLTPPWLHTSDKVSQLSPCATLVTNISYQWD